MTLVLNGTTGVSSVDGSAGTPAVQGTDTNTGVFFPAADTVAISTGGTEKVRVDSSGNVGINKVSPAYKLDVDSGTTGGIAARFNGSAVWAGSASTNVYINGGFVTDTLLFGTQNNERMRIDSSGNVGIGTTSISDKLHVAGNIRSGGTDGNVLAVATTGSAALAAVSNSRYWRWITSTADTGALRLNDETAGVERMRVTSGGRLLVNTTVDDPVGSNAVGTAIVSGVVITTADNQPSLYVNRKATDGVVVTIAQDGISEGTISVSGTTVSYNSFAGSHWSQLSDNLRPDILTGTVVETIDEKCAWPGEDNDQLAKFKVSDTVASKRVYGVFMAWDNDDDENNDAYITGLGAYLIRVAPGMTVEGGDLLESNGDGCARVQADDIIRSSTIAKVTCNIPTETYDDGSYTVPCVLYCG